MRAPLRGAVEVDGGLLVDEEGPFWAVGASYMSAVWFYKHDRARLEKNLAFLADGGIDYIRVLGEVGGAFWEGRETDPRWPDYDEVVAGLTDLAYDRYGLRVEWTLFGWVGFSPTPGDRAALVDRFAAMAARRPHKILHFEIANEYWQNGFGGDAGLVELRELTHRLQERLRAAGVMLPVAPSAPAGNTCAEWLTLYERLGADLATIHFDRTTDDVEGRWRPVRMPWTYRDCQGMPDVASNNEPIGPGSSGDDENDPLRLVSAAVVTFMARSPLYVLHSIAGIRGDLDFDALPNVQETMAGFRALRRVLPRSLPAWTAHDHDAPQGPLELRSPVSPGLGAREGAVAAFASVRDDQFLVVTIGLRERVVFRARRAMSIELLDLLDGQRLDQRSLAAGESFPVEGRAAVVIRGKWQ